MERRGVDSGRRGAANNNGNRRFRNREVDGVRIPQRRSQQDGDRRPVRNYNNVMSGLGPRQQVLDQSTIELLRNLQDRIRSLEQRRAPQATGRAGEGPLTRLGRRLTRSAPRSDQQRPPAVERQVRQRRRARDDVPPPPPRRSDRRSGRWGANQTNRIDNNDGRVRIQRTDDELPTKRRRGEQQQTNSGRGWSQRDRESRNQYPPLRVHLR